MDSKGSRECLASLIFCLYLSRDIYFPLTDCTFSSIYSFLAGFNCFLCLLLKNLHYCSSYISSIWTEELYLCSFTIIIRIHMLSSQTMKSFYYAPLMPVFFILLILFSRSWNNFKKQNFVSSPDTLRSVFSFTDYISVSQLGWNEHTYRSVSYYKYTLFTTVATDRTMFGQYRLFFNCFGWKTHVINEISHRSCFGVF